MILDNVFTAIVADYVERHSMCGTAEIAMWVDHEVPWEGCSCEVVRAWARGESLPGEHIRQFVVDRIWEEDAEPEIVEKTQGQLEQEADLAAGPWRCPGCAQPSASGHMPAQCACGYVP